MVSTEVVTRVDGRRVIPFGWRGYGAGSPLGPHEQALVTRIETLDRILPHVHFMWSFVERTAQEYRSDVAQSHVLPIGCVGLVPDELRRSPKDIDVLFFGHRTGHRARAIAGIEAAGLRVVAAGGWFERGWVPDSVLESLIDRARIGLSLPMYGAGEGLGGIDPRFASGIRMHQMLTRGLLVVSEDIPLDNPYRPYIVSAPVDALGEACRQLLAGGRWRELGEHHARRLRDEMDVRRICTPVIERTLASLG